MIEKKGKLVEILDCKKVIVAGDIHGDLEAFENVVRVFEDDINGHKNVCLIFLGDYADRGDFGVEVIESLKILMKKHPGSIIALKGNHEDYDDNGEPKFYPCDLKYEVESKRGIWVEYFERNLKDLFSSLPIAAKYNSYLFVHGGISSKIKNWEDLINPSASIEEDILWSDPFEGYGEYPNPRGAGVLFGKNITERVLSNLKVEKVIRSHQPKKALKGIFIEHDEKIITISSTRVYGGSVFILEICGKNMKAKRIL
jgi:predicted phosphodiesterase